MAIKNMATTALFFVQDASTGLGVPALTSGNFTSIKLAQDNILSAELQPIAVSGYGGGYYGFAVTAPQMNYGCIMPIVISSGNFQPYGVAMYTEQNYLPVNSGVLATNAATINTISGNLTNLDNVVDTVSGNLTSTSGSLAGWVWDEVLSGTTHNISRSAGRRLRQIGQYSIYEGTLPSQAGVSGNAIKLDTGASSVSGSYDPSMITITTGNGEGQSRMVYQYDGFNRIAWLDRDWKIQPAAGDEYQILADAGREHVNEGLIRAATSNTVQLNTGASTVDNNYVGQIVFIKGGTGQDQIRVVMSYVGSTQTVTVDENWDIVPGTDSTYVMLPYHIHESVLVSGFINGALGQIVASGNAAGWADVTPVTDLAGLSGSLATISGNLLTVQNNLSTVSGNVTTVSNNLNTVSGNLTTTNNTLNTVSGNVTTNYNSTISAIQNVQNSTFIAAAIPTILEIPDTGSVTVPVTVAISNDVGQAVNIDGSLMPSGTLTNDAGADLTSRLSAWSNPATGKYVVNYTNASGHAIEGLHWELLATVSGNMYRYPGFTQLVDTTAVDFTAADRAVLNAAAQQTTLVTVQNNLATVSGIVNNLPTISTIVTSGNAEGWNDVTPATDLAGISGSLATISGNLLRTEGTLNTVSGLVNNLPSIGQIVLSGNANNWNADTNPVTVSGFTPASLTQVVNSGNAANWNSVTSVDLSGISGSLNTISGNLLRTENTLITVSGNIAALNDVSITEIVASGNAAGWSNVTPATDLSGISGQINGLSGQMTLNNSIISTVSGNVTTLQNTVNTVSGNLNTGVTVTVSGLTPSALSQIVSSGNAANWAADTVNVTVSGLTPAALSQIVASGDAANWGADTVQVTVSGLTPQALSQIVSSGTTAGWAADTVEVDISGVSPAALAQIVSGVLNGTMTELTTDPGANPTLQQAEMLKYMDLRNKRVQEDPTGTNKYYMIHKNDNTVLASGKIEDIAISGIFIKGKLNF